MSIPPNLARFLIKAAMTAYRTNLPKWIPKPARDLIRFSVGFVTGLYVNQNFDLPPVNDVAAIKRYILDPKPKNE